MKIVRCDMCKKEKSRDDFFKTLVLPIDDTFHSIHEKFKSIDDFSFKEVDLCCDCLNELRRWLLLRLP